MQSVPAWTDRPGPSEPRIGTRVYCVPPNSKPDAFWLIGNVVWCEVHWFQEADAKWRTVPHLKEECRFCSIDRNPPFQKGYIAAQHDRAFHASVDAAGKFVAGCRRWTPCVLDLPTDAAHLVEDLGVRLGGLKGCILMVSRPGSRKNSPLRVEYAETRALDNPPTIDVHKVCENMWRRYLWAKPGATARPELYRGGQVVDGPTPAAVPA